MNADANAAEVKVERILHVCPIAGCGKEYARDKSFKKHLDTHFQAQQSGALRQVARYNSTPPKSVVEAMLIDTLGEMFNTFKVTWEETSKLSKTRSFMVATKIAADHLQLANECLVGAQAVTLAPKHRQLRELLPVWATFAATAVASIDIDTVTEPELLGTAHMMMTILSDFHTILHEDTTFSVRKQIVAEWNEVGSKGMANA